MEAERGRDITIINVITHGRRMVCLRYCYCKLLDTESRYCSSCVSVQLPLSGYLVGWHTHYVVWYSWWGYLQNSSMWCYSTFSSLQTESSHRTTSLSDLLLSMTFHDSPWWSCSPYPRPFSSLSGGLSQWAQSKMWLLFTFVASLNATLVNWFTYGYMTNLFSAFLVSFCLHTRLSVN